MQFFHPADLVTKGLMVALGTLLIFFSLWLAYRDRRPSSIYKSIAACLILMASEFWVLWWSQIAGMIPSALTELPSKAQYVARDDAVSRHVWFGFALMMAAVMLWLLRVNQGWLYLAYALLLFQFNLGSWEVYTRNPLLTEQASLVLQWGLVSAAFGAVAVQIAGWVQRPPERRLTVVA